VDDNALHVNVIPHVKADGNPALGRKNAFPMN